MDLIINGSTEKIKQDTLTVVELLAVKKVEAPEMVSVQLNGEFVRRADFAATPLKENDAVDFLYFMGGGADDERIYD
ncbi:MAG: sulfur carrier protein ThiS [Candidatus Margulisbacteria bacterium]|jgi:sulfur carrier protein|nr:sulfur carrier protein ThiS [Candidatus Margulisiibacteriota bacterium]